MISVKTFSPEIKTVASCFIKMVYIINIFYHLRAVNETFIMKVKAQYEKGKITGELNIFNFIKIFGRNK